MPSSDRRPWVRLDTSYFRNMKIVRISDAAKVLHLTLITTAAEQRTDGVLPVQVCKQKGPKPFKELVDNGPLRESWEGLRDPRLPQAPDPRPGDLQESRERRPHQVARAEKRSPTRTAHTARKPSSTPAPGPPTRTPKAPF